MLIQTFAIRLLTVLAYFLPFTFFMATCSGEDVVLVYNKQEAYEVKKKELRHQMETIDGLLDQKDTSQQTRETIHTLVEHAMKSDLESVFDRKGQWYEKVLSPAPYCLSGIGTLFYYKTTGMAVTMWMSVIFSLLTFLFWKFLKRWMITILFIGGNFIVLLIYMLSCFSNHVSLEYGFWLLFFLVVLQSWIELLELKYSIIGRLLMSISKK